MASLLELDEFEVPRRSPVPAPRRAPITWPPAGKPTIMRHPKLGYLHVYPPQRRARPQSEVESEVIGVADTRGFVKDTTPVPYRFICWLALTFIHPVTGAALTGRGTGTLISARHVLTAGPTCSSTSQGIGSRCTRSASDPASTASRSAATSSGSRTRATRSPPNAGGRTPTTSSTTA